MTQEEFEFRGFTRLKQVKHLIQTGQIDQDFFWRKPRGVGKQQVNQVD
jgi:hypothetical protein